ncbi:hypothetical protein [Halorubrum halophilum]|uniref:hypothetical protein n=1 Tax=Halorubrum halophilum TaxID=413816 RepID=UPI00186ACB5C|nr:hypothetical protein [Halorubrum halophilum]
MYRRTLLGGLSVTFGGLAGCQAPLVSGPPRIDLELYNYTPDPQPVQIRVLRTDRDEYDDARVFSREFEVPSRSDEASAGTLKENDIVERRPYLLRVRPKFGDGQWYHHHYYPGESATDEDSVSLDIRLRQEESTGDVYPRFSI